MSAYDDYASDFEPDAEHLCAGCHDGDFADFDHYCDAKGITTEELPAAFAAWLHLASDGEWDGEMEQVDDV